MNPKNGDILALANYPWYNLNDPYSLVKPYFMKATDLNDDLIAEANSQGLLIGAKELREYFHIDYTENLEPV